MGCPKRFLSLLKSYTLNSCLFFLGAQLWPRFVGDPDALDLEDLLFSEPTPEEWRNIWTNCGETSEKRRKKTCLKFSVQDWGLTSYNALVYQGAYGPPCAEDFSLVPATCGSGGMACRTIKGQCRIVGFAGELGGGGGGGGGRTRIDLTTLSRLPHLSSLVLDGPSAEDLQGHRWPPTLRFLRLVAPSGGAVAAAAAALRGQRHLRSLQIHGRQDLQRWTPVDLADFCGQDLVHFSAFVIEVVRGAVPDCWKKMTNLRNFYCSNCMLSSAPTALRGLQSLRSFVAFRQWEMVPCALQHLPNSTGCKASWETRHLSKGGDRSESTGDWGDFQ